MILWVIFVLLLFPILNLSTCWVRSYFLYQACHGACLEASKARSFEVSSGTDLSAKATADQVARQTANSWSGVRISSVDTQIITTNINTLVQSYASGRLTTAPDTERNNFQVMVRVRGEVDPLIPFGLNLFGGVPGVTGPMPVSIVDRAYFENIQGLTR